MADDSPEDGSFGRDLATIGVGVGIPATFLIGVVLVSVTAFTGRIPAWLLVPFVLVAVAAAWSYVAIRRGGG